MQKRKTHKLFYNKWPYKIDCRIKKASSIHRLGISRTYEWINGSNDDKWAWKDANRVDIKQFTDSFAPFIGKELQVRSEGSHFNIFVKDHNLYTDIVDSMGRWITCLTEPGSNEEYDFLINSTTKKIICNEFPKGKYQYRIYIKEKMPVDARERFYTWMERYNDQFNLAGSTKAWLQGKKPYIQDPFFYIQDQHLLSMAGLYLGNYVKRVEEFIPRDKINT